MMMIADNTTRVQSTAGAEEPQEGTAKTRYKQLLRYREPFLDRAEDCSEITIPYLITREEHSDYMDLPTPYQSLGTRGTLHLTNKMLMAHFPPNVPFFKLSIDDFTAEAVQAAAQQFGEQAPDPKAELESSLGKIERAVMREVEVMAIRSTLSSIFKHLIVAGNAAVYMTDSGRLKVYSLKKYVVCRDMTGNVLEAILCDEVSPRTLPSEISEGDGDDKNVEIYTHIFRDENNKFRVYQEANGHVLEDSRGVYSPDDLPYMFLRWHSIDGEHYGRGHIEDYLGDIRSLEGLVQSLVEAGAIASRHVALVNPNGMTDIEDFAKAENGEAIPGRIDDVQFAQANKHHDVRATFDTAVRIEERLSHAFLLHSAVQRDAERVTAEEIRFMAEELESALGGVYTVIAQELQLPIAKLLLRRMRRQKKIPAFNDKVVDPMITTGIEALGRGHDLRKLQQLIGVLSPLGEQVMMYINVGQIVLQAATALGIPREGLVKTEEQLTAERNQAQMQQLVQQLGPNAVNQAGGALRDAIQGAGGGGGGEQQQQPPAQPSE